MNTRKEVTITCKYCDGDIVHELMWRDAVLHIKCPKCDKWNYVEFKNYVKKW